MKKNTVIRNDAPHAVKMQEGSNVAERKFKKPPLSAEPETAADIKKSVKPAPTPTVTQTIAKPPARTPAKTRAKVILKMPPEATPVVPVSSPQALKDQVAMAPQSMLLSDADLWEQESPINDRLSALQTRNALLKEQLQRLKPPFQARGKSS